MKKWLYPCKEDSKMNEKTHDLVTRLERNREEINKQGIKAGESQAVVRLDEEHIHELMKWPQNQVAEILGVVNVQVDRKNENQSSVEVKKAEGSNCLRCRRMVACPGEELCSRCQEVVG